MEVWRTEQKYIINRTESLLLRRRLDPIMPKDAHCGPGGYDVRSVYFDTVGDGCCAEKEDGLRLHEKIRIRVYGGDDRVIKLESKKKQGEVQHKMTMLISRQMCEELLAARYEGLLKEGSPNALYFYNKLSRGMLPKALIQYDRISYCLPVNNTRVTFDSNVRASESCFDLFLPKPQTHPALSPDLTIAEVKYNHFLLGYVKNQLGSLNQSTTAYSKYFSGRDFYRRLL